jgi:hypothetical protein
VQRQPLDPRPGRGSHERSQPKSVELVAQTRTPLGVSDGKSQSARR